TLELPERGLGLEPVDQELAGLEGCLAVRRGGHHQDDAIAGLEPAVAVDDQGCVEFPPAARLGLDLSELLLGHARIMLERHGADAVATRGVAHHADKTYDAADLVPILGEPRDLGAHVEVLALDPDHLSLP